MYQRERPAGPEKVAGRWTTNPTGMMPESAGVFKPRMTDIRDVLPKTGLLRAYVDWAATATPVPGWYTFYTILPVFAHELSLRGYTCLGEPFRFWIGLVGPTGSGKSTASLLAQDFTKAWFDVRARDMGPTPDPFVSISSASVEATVHAIGEKYQQQSDSSCAIAVADEFTSVVQRKGFLEFLNTIYDSRNYALNYMKYRGTDTKTLIKNPRVSLCVLTTIDALNVNAERDFSGGGMLNRINWVREQAMPYDDEDRVREYESITSAWQAWSRKLIVNESMGFRHGGETYAWPKNITIDPVARPLFKKLAMKNGDLSMADGHVGTYYRAAGAAKMIACMLAIADGRPWATVEDTEIACKLCEKGIGAAIKTAHEIDKRNPDFSMQERVYEAIQEAGSQGTSMRELSRQLHLTADQLRRHTDGLKSMGTIHAENVRGSMVLKDARFPLSVELN